jgi:[protein-PII] uridylyltransferase
MVENGSRMLQLAPSVLLGRRQLAEAWQQWSARFWAGQSPWEIARAIRDFRAEQVCQAVVRAAESIRWPIDLLGERLAVVAHGGFGRGDLAPFSDTDLLFLFRSGSPEPFRPIVAQVTRELTDIGLSVGHSVMTPLAACRLALADPQVLTSLTEACLLWGSKRLFCQFQRWMKTACRIGRWWLHGRILQARAEERLRFGETVYLNEPNVKRSEGALRDLHMIRWLAALCVGSPDWTLLGNRGWLAADDQTALEQAWTFLLRVRQGMHFHLGRPTDSLTRWEQVQLAERFGYQARDGLLPVELFMRDYFRHTYLVGRIVRLLSVKSRPAESLRRRLLVLTGKKSGPHWVITRREVLPTRAGVQRLAEGLEGVLELLLISAKHGKKVDVWAWEQVRAAHSGRGESPSPRARALFWQLLEGSPLLGELVQELHQAGVLERFVPGLARARGLLQFNQYHKYTVDKHCLQALAWAISLASSKDLLGEVYRLLPRRAVLHLALLMHDLGKGFEEDHCEVGKRLAAEAAQFFELSPQDTEDLLFLVGRHLAMNHLAFRRDINDEQLVVQFAVEVGSPERLGMLFILTAADLAAVGPGGWNSWKADVLTELYHRALRHLTGDPLAHRPEEMLRQKREAVARWLGPLAHDPWFARQLEHLPSTYLGGTAPSQVAQDLRLLSGLQPHQVHVEVTWSAQRETIQVVLATNEAIGPGIFHKLTGAVSSLGLEILAADIHTLEDGWVIDRLEARDPDYSGVPPEERLQAVAEKIRGSVQTSGPLDFRFRQSWFTRSASRPTLAYVRNRVQISNNLSPQFTVIDVFAADRPGLLFTIARTLFELGLSVARARIGTYLDQVVDVFYVTDQAGGKVTDPVRLEEIRRRVLAVVESVPLD